MPIDCVADLFAGGPEHVRRFVAAITERAIRDHTNRVKTRITGQDLIDDYARDCRRFHRRMAIGLYNEVRRTLELAEKESSK